MWPYSWTHVGTPSRLGRMDRVAATMPSQAHAGAAQEAPNIGQWEGQDVPLVRPSSCTVKGGIPSSRRYLPTYLNNPIGVFAQPTLRPSPPHCLHPLPIPCQNDSASQKLVLKEDNVLFHIPHLLVEVGEDVQASQKSLFIPAIHAKP